MSLKKCILSLSNVLSINYNLCRFSSRVCPLIKTVNFTSFNMNFQQKNNIVWMDMELSGLDVENDKILEIACLVTNDNLELISPSFRIVINQPNDILNKMDEWCKKTHAETGLIDEVKESTVDIAKAQTMLLNFLEPFTVDKSNPLAGNTVWMDRLFLRKYMHDVDECLSYRIIDVSTIKELCRRWNPSVFNQAPKKKLLHCATEDIKESIEELKYYKKYFFVS